MKYILTAGWDDGIADLTARLARELSSDKRVLWLTCGGSNITAAAQIMDTIAADLSKNLTVSLSDERYGEPGHPNSNWTQLLEAGFNAKAATLLPILQPGQSLEQATDYYTALITKAFAENDVIIAQLGIGEDGHIAGILPGSPAANEQAKLISGYESAVFDRLTLTFAALRQLHVAYAFAFGAPKKVALQQLQAEQIDLQTVPAQILRELPEAYLYSDQVGAHA